jgi:hypothetical protein
MVLTFDQASQIKNDFTFLIGQPYFADSKELFVDDIVIAPYDPVNRQIFLKNYDMLGSDEEALEWYPKSFYTVLLITRYDPDMVYEEIFNYAKHSNIQIDYSKYGLQSPNNDVTN